MEHVMSYFNAELGVPCSLDPEGKLTFKVWGLKLLAYEALRSYYMRPSATSKLVYEALSYECMRP